MVRYQFRTLLRCTVVAVAIGLCVTVGAGVAAAAAGRINTAGSPLTVRSGPGTGYAAVSQIADGTAVTISCQDTGTSVTGTYGTSRWWDKIGAGRFVSDAYVYTGSDGRVAPDCTPSPPGDAAAAVIAAAKSQLDQQYSWGGGNFYGPTYGICCSPSGYDDRHVMGFDCSGLMEYAFYQGANVKLPSTSRLQYDAGRKIARDHMVPGDMLFWSTNISDPSQIHHVALYIGNGKIIEALDHQADLHLTYYSTSGLMPYVVRAIS
ncbi:MAG: NlpC/P60 family protein [Pseudonocardiales bacterium]